MDHAVLIFTGGLIHKLETATAKNLSLQVFSLHLQTSNIILCVDRIALPGACRCSNTDTCCQPMQHDQHQNTKRELQKSQRKVNKPIDEFLKFIWRELGLSLSMSGNRMKLVLTTWLVCLSNSYHK